MISYRTNWMGPVSIQWYIDRGLTVKKEINSKMFGHHIINEITEHWAGGRIDIRGSVYDEINLPIMHGEDYNNFSKWLDSVETETIWSLAQLVEEYEKTHSKIRWANDEFNG